MIMTRIIIGDNNDDVDGKFCSNAFIVMMMMMIKE